MKARRLLATMLAGALLVGACGGGNDNDEDETVGGDDLTTTTAPGADSTAPDGADGSGTTTRGGATATTRRGSSAATNPSGANPSETAVVATAPGVYTYKAKGTSTAKGTVNNAPFNTSKQIDRTWTAEFKAPSGRTQSATYGGDAPPYFEQTLSYSGDNVAWTLLKVNSGNGSVTFRPNPPARFVPASPAVGATWSWTMVSEPNNQGRSTTRKGEFKVDRADTVTIGGEAVPVFVITGTVTVDQPFERTLKYTTYYSQALKLIVREREISDSDVRAKDTDLHIHSDVTSTVESVRPAPPAPAQ